MKPPLNALLDIVEKNGNKNACKDQQQDINLIPHDAGNQKKEQADPIEEDSVVQKLRSLRNLGSLLARGI